MTQWYYIDINYSFKLYQNIFSIFHFNLCKNLKHNSSNFHQVYIKHNCFTCKIHKFHSLWSTPSSYILSSWNQQCPNYILTNIKGIFHDCIKGNFLFNRCSSSISYFLKYIHHSITNIGGHCYFAKECYIICNYKFYYCKLSIMSCFKAIYTPKYCIIRRLLISKIFQIRIKYTIINHLNFFHRLNRRAGFWSKARIKNYYSHNINRNISSNCFGYNQSTLGIAWNN